MLLYKSNILTCTCINGNLSPFDTAVSFSILVEQCCFIISVGNGIAVLGRLKLGVNL